MKTLIVGSGGREHALAWKLARGDEAGAVYCAPGNAGTERIAQNVDISADDHPRLAEFARRESVALTVVGPERPLCGGIGEVFAAEGLPLVGPVSAAARLEGSKIFAKEFMARWKIPTAPFAVFDAVAPAQAYIDGHPSALVVKADGLAGGKGVFVCDEPGEAKEVVSRLLGQGELGAAARRVVVEERVLGEEVSVIALSDGRTVIPLASSQDHKAAYEGDRGPNTGGMGAYSPATVLTPELEARVMAEVLQPAVAGMAAEGHCYRGVLYAGLMIEGSSLVVLEFNCRFGDPETQPLMMRLDGDLFPYLRATASGHLAELPPPAWSHRPALCVVMAAEGYPGPVSGDATIHGLQAAQAVPGVEVFHAGTARRGEAVVTAGGRVLGVTGSGGSFAEARDAAYAAVGHIAWDGAWYRRDIGHRILEAPAGDRGGSRR